MSLPSRLISHISGFVNPVEARKVEKGLTVEVQELLRAFVAAGVTEPPKPKKKPEPPPADNQTNEENSESPQSPV